MDKSSIFPPDSVRRTKTTSLTASSLVLPHAIWSFGLGRITTLVPVSLAATVDAMAGFGSKPIQKRIGSKPCIGLMKGHSDIEPGAIASAKDWAGSSAALRPHDTRRPILKACLLNFESLMLQLSIRRGEYLQ